MTQTKAYNLHDLKNKILSCFKCVENDNAISYDFFHFWYNILTNKQMSRW